MKSSPDKSDDTPTPPDTSSAIALLKDIGDVTWRMFLPILLGLGLGVMLDNSMGIGPWGVIAGLAVGLAGTTILIRGVYRKL